MKYDWLFKIVILFSLGLSACAPSVPNPASTQSPSSNDIPSPSTPISAENPCVGAPAPAQWKHIVVLMFENKKYNEVIGPAPYITSLADKCATALNWHDSDTKVDGSPDGNYHSKPSYATLTNGLSPSVHGLISDKYETTTDVDNIYHQLDLAGKSFRDYYEGQAGGCSVRFNGDYHDAIRYYTSVANICDAHDVPLSTFKSDVVTGNLPVFSLLLPEKDHSMHDNSITDGDAYAKSILEPLLNSQEYRQGDVAIFFLWDENTPVPNVLIAASIVPGTKIKITSGNPISHFSALRTWEEMLGLPLLGDTGQAPSLLLYFDGGKLQP